MQWKWKYIQDYLLTHWYEDAWRQFDVEFSSSIGGSSFKTLFFWTYNENISTLNSTSPTGGIPETQRKWSTSTLPSGSPSPVWGKPCPLSPLSPAQHWWRLPWSHPDPLRRLKSQASRWEPDSPGTRWARRRRSSFEQRRYLNTANHHRTDTEIRSSHLDCLAVVDFDDMKAETVDSFPRCHEDAPRWIEMTADIHQDLRRKDDEAGE